MLHYSQVLKHPEGGSIIVMEYLDLHGLSKYAGQLGLDIARFVSTFSSFFRFKGDVLHVSSSERNPPALSQGRGLAPTPPPSPGQVGRGSTPPPPPIIRQGTCVAPSLSPAPTCLGKVCRGPTSVLNSTRAPSPGQLSRDLFSY